MLEQGSVCKINLDTEPRSKKSRYTPGQVHHRTAKAGRQQQTGSSLYRLTFSMESPIIKVWRPRRLPHHDTLKRNRGH